MAKGVMGLGSGPRVTAEDREWQAKCDMRALREAEEIMKDSKRAAAARAAASKEIKELQAVAAKKRSTK